MGSTKIEWCDKSWSPITGCSPISEGCVHCYAKRMAYRLKGRFGYPKDDPFRVTFHPDRLDEPLHWKKPSRIFVCSMGDLFHEDVPMETIGKILCFARAITQHKFLFLTKRPKRMREALLAWDMNGDVIEQKVDHLFFGVSIENQRTAYERIPILLQIQAAKRFVSVEPMLSNILISPYLYEKHWHPQTLGGNFKLECGNECKPKLDWVICGGETGPKARPMNPDWARSLRDQSQAAGVPFFFKQITNKKPIPKDLMIREFPK